MTAPAPLSELPPNPNLVDVSTTITGNYSLYHKVAAQLVSLQQWVIMVREESLNVNGRNKD
jgi:hypothetical protein